VLALVGTVVQAYAVELGADLGEELGAGGGGEYL
jgi:hypothetical protein